MAVLIVWRSGPAERLLLNFRNSSRPFFSNYPSFRPNFARIRQTENSPASTTCDVIPADWQKNQIEFFKHNFYWTFGECDSALIRVLIFWIAEITSPLFVFIFKSNHFFFLFVSASCSIRSQRLTAAAVVVEENVSCQRWVRVASWRAAGADPGKGRCEHWT